MRDKYNRKIDYMRISLTDRCNFRCKYCMPEDGIDKLSHDDILSIEEITKIVQMGSRLGIRKVRLTGGEPSVRKGFLELCKNIGQIEEIKDLRLTSNGSLLYPILEELKDAGLNAINFSLDTLDPKKFEEISGKSSLDEVLRSIDKAYELGFRVKINSVLIGGFNTDEIDDLVGLSKDRDIQVRFIELMPMGQCQNWPDSAFVSNDQTINMIEDLRPLSVEGVAQVYKKPGHKGTVGFISPISCSFCQDCNRIRLTADGKLKPCLHSSEEINIRGLEDEKLEIAMKRAIFNKPESHNLDQGSSKSKRYMNAIGG